MFPLGSSSSESFHYPDEKEHLVLIFGVVLLASVLLSDIANRTVLSTAVLFLFAGFLCGGVFGWINVRPGDPTVSGIAELALVAVLFTDGMKVGFRDCGCSIGRYFS